MLWRWRTSIEGSDCMLHAWKEHRYACAEISDVPLLQLIKINDA